MHLHLYRDESRSRHFDLVGEGDHPWTIDFVTVTAAAILVVGFACALVAHFGPVARHGDVFWRGWSVAGCLLVGGRFGRRMIITRVSAFDQRGDDAPDFLRGSLPATPLAPGPK